MAFDSQIRNKLARLVTDARNLLTDEFTKQLQEIFGIQPDGTIIPLEKLTHLTDEQMSVASVLRDRVDHLAAGLTSEKKPVIAAIDRMTREQSFTILNRFAALRMSEERGIVQECVRGRMQSKGFQVYLKVSGSGLGDQYERYKAFLFCIFDEIAVDLGILFDRFSPFGLLFPREPALQGLLGIINTPELKTIWAEDETIGWIYQYFNSVEERKAMREASAAPRNSRELAVRNQFFTPRYVVEFLTDNTLGRIWYEMRKGDTRLKEECRYLVRRPNEVFLGPGEKAPQRDETDENLSQEELLKKPVYIGHRLKKDPRDIRVLDPACGSGHFLLYAFILLLLIYEEAWEDTESSKSEATGKTLQEDYNTLDALRQAVPKLIIEHNLHGIDIDPRCTQIAALALWLRAQKSWKDLGLRAADRPQIDRSNIVTAEPMPGEDAMRREFTESLKPRVLGQLVSVVFEKMKLAGEAGSLLKIEEEIKESIAEAKRQWVKSPEMEQVALFPHLIKRQPKQEKLRFDVKGITDEAFWDQAEERILASLRDFAEQVENGRAMRRRLFAEDAARGFAFIDLCRKRYDVVLMNPPYGDASPETKNYFKNKFQGQPNDLFACFIERYLSTADFVGSLTSRTFLFFSSFESLRTQILFPLKQITSVIDLGFGVLDGAMVETCAMVSKNQSSGVSQSIFIRLNDSEEKATTLLEAIDAVHMLRTNARLFPVYQSVFEAIDGAPMPYWVGQTILSRLLFFPSVYPDHADIRLGVVTSDNDQYLRLRWEVAIEQIDPNAGWASYAKGGDYSKFFGDIHLLIDWRGNGEHIKQTFGQAVRLRELDQYLKPGLTYPLVTVKGMNVRVLPADCVFDNGSPSIFLANDDDRLVALGILNSRIAEVYVRCFTSSRHWQVGYVRKIPWPAERITVLKESLRNLTSEAVQIPRAIFQRIEPTAEFTGPRLLQSGLVCNSLNDLIELGQKRFRADRARFHELEKALDDAAKECYTFSSEEWSIVEREIPALEDSRDQFAQIEDQGGDFVAETFSWSFGCVLGRWDVRFAFNAALEPKLPDPFDPLPVCPPGMLVGPEGFPAEANRIVSEEWLRARPDANSIPPEGIVKNPTISDAEYPLRISWNGILVDDAENPEDVIHRIREVLDLLWKDKGPEIEHEGCDILGVSDLRDYFRKPTRFFQDHLKRYSKSRRKAPIYWPLSTASGSYTLWLYYHRLTDQTLFMCVQDFVEPKIKETERDIERLQKELQNGKKSIRDEVDRLMDFRQEFIDFRNELLRVAKLPYKPNLNDGVMISACPLWKLFRHNAWSRDLKDCWEKMEAGEYDWAHLAYGIWPDRVREVCKSDRSIAIAHGLEDLYQGEIPIKKSKGKLKK